MNVCRQALCEEDPNPVVLYAGQAQPVVRSVNPFVVIEGGETASFRIVEAQEQDYFLMGIVVIIIGVVGAVLSELVREPEPVETDLRRLASVGYNSWLDNLPDDDWSEEVKLAIPIKWDSKTKTWIEKP